MLRHSHEKTTFLAENRSSSQGCEIEYWPPSSLPLKVVPLSFEYGLLLLATLIMGGGGITSTRSWTGYLPKYGLVSQVLLQLVGASIRRSYTRRFATTNFRVTMLWQCCDNSKHFRNICSITFSLRSFPSFTSIRHLQKGRDNTCILSVGLRVNETPSGAGLPKNFKFVL